MKKMWKQRARGAISIFLLIIFVAQYVLCGLLVDGARHRMAEAMAESALDSASMSVLSYYNQLVYDLYGLMATDKLSEEEIKTLLTSYVEKTLGTVEVEAGLLEPILKALENAFDAGTKFDGYDFQLEPIEAKIEVSLANTDFTEYQIIEHMKYRAPIQMLNDSEGFLSKLKNLGEISDRLKMTKDRLKIVKENQEKLEKAADTLSEIDAFIENASAYVTDPVNWTSDSAAPIPELPADIYYYVGPIDNEANRLAREYLGLWNRYRVEYKEWCDYLDRISSESEEESEEGSSEDPGPPPPPPEEPKWYPIDWAEKLLPSIDEPLEKYQTIINNARELREKADALIQKIDTGVSNYASYISKMNAKYREYGGDNNSNAATVFLPEEELAEANAGQLLKNRPFLSYISSLAREIEEAEIFRIKAKLEEIVQGELQISGYVGGMALDISQRMEEVEGVDENDLDRQYSLPDPICTYAIEIIGPSHLNYIPGTLQQMVYVLRDNAIPGVKPSEINVRVNGDKAKEKAKKDESIDVRDLESEDLAVTYQNGGVGDPSSLEGLNRDLDENAGEGLLNAAGEVLDFLLELLEGARDNLYINEYIVSYFPNYVHTCKVSSEKVPEKAKKFVSGGTHEKYCASQAEVEYILVGDPKGQGSVLKVQGMLLGVRSAFNLVAIFTDSAKVSQANAISAAAGPFAPAVAIALLIGWAVAESVIDVQKLCKGEEVPLFKQGSDWYLSAEHAVETAIIEAVETVVDYGVKEATKNVDAIAGKVENVANQAIYAAYNGGVNTAKGVMSKWSDNVNESFKNIKDEIGEAPAVQDILNEVNTSFQEKINSAQATVEGRLTNVKDQAIEKVSKASENVKKDASEKLESMGDKISDRLASSLSTWVSDKIPVGDVAAFEQDGVKSKSEFPGLTYMDYIQIFLLMQNRTTKVQRIQSLVQANMRYGGQKEFLMEKSYGALQAKLNGTIKFLFMSEPIVPSGLRQNGRLKFSVDSAVSY